MKNTAVAAPDWLARNSIYQINPRTFSKEGTLRSVKDELEFIQSLGFNVIYLCPIFEEDESSDPENISPRQKKSNTDNPKNPYRMKDYFFIDDEYGTMDDFRALVEEIHARGMRILLDVVYAHIGPNAPILAKHPEFAEQNADGSFVYTRWNFPKFDFRCEGLREYLYSNMMYYISAFDVDGYRCDVGDLVPIDFWKEARRRMRAVKADAVLINEGREYDRLAVAFDASYCFDWHTTLYNVFCCNEPAHLLRDYYQSAAPELPADSLLLRDIDNHDTVTDWPQRAEVAAGNDGMEQIEVINYLIDGIPMVYSGNELACTARLSMFANRFYRGDFEVTDRNDKTSDAAVRRMSVLQRLNQLKAESDLLRYGKTHWLETDAKDSVISFQRVYGDETIVFVGSTKSEEVTTALSDSVARTVLLENNMSLSDDSVTFGPYGYVVFASKR